MDQRKDILRPRDEAAGSEFAQGRRGDPRIEREVEGLQGLVRSQTALGKSAPELFEVASVEKLGVTPLLSERLAETLAEGVEHAGQLQTRQLGLQEC